MNIPSNQDIMASNFYKSLIEGEKCRIVNNEYAIWYLENLKYRLAETETVNIDFEIDEYKNDISMAIDTIRKARESIIYIKRRVEDGWYDDL
ncbi:hypothetical protein PBCVCVB1_656L [Paramecium bursaria Chlorella virus CVB-1]|nr:hypothetical protein PBCVCVB1_656L [Paramecium bursaria Chlorella virus CVB-1]